MSEWDEQAVAALVVSMCEPLLDHEILTGIHVGAQRAFREAPQLARVWAGGFLFDLINSLPSGDPWRSPGEGFGTWRDGADLIPPAHPNLFTDVGLAALAAPLAPGSAQLIRDVTSTPDLDHVLANFAHRVLDQDLYSTALPALRWAAWRRRAYVGPEEPFVMLSGFGWLRRAEDIRAGLPWSRQPWAEDAKAARIPDEEYDAVPLNPAPAPISPTR